MLMMAGREVTLRVRERAGAEGKDLRMAAAVVAMVVVVMAVVAMAVEGGAALAVALVIGAAVEVGHGRSSWATDFPF